jgi:diaminopimelate epimerase
MIKKIHFTKMVASGNDFIVIDRRRGSIQKPNLSAVEVCDRKYGIGADGLLILEKSQNADIRMRIFNPDGSEPQMCGNAVKCVALYAGRNRIKVQTKAGIIEARVSKNRHEAKIRMSRPENIKLDIAIKINKRTIRVNFINTGVPHVVIFAEGLDKIDVVNIGRQIRNYPRFLPEGTNVDFVQIIDDNNIKLRTYERGVEGETLACGTGAVAAALIYAVCYPPLDFARGRLSAKRKINVHTKGREVLKVDFNSINNKFKDVWLEGKARAVYSGVYYV